ncbi:hypothetical protein HYH02_010899 [Chlamydomonas schloesseri]|uniref:Mitochondrial carrier protein n=1 Tax=Chlamydomonas schloesseri TaxID=2026947 RepID=A0A835T409_9CHLO|nr:hypothetical protein HYH02_010899 [Chlamydomonas schloesseri]|eukprot:KAG2438444.1 hypothetical protein HYH02_010899 [Chlamydomonas schloesseri]
MGEGQGPGEGPAQAMPAIKYWVRSNVPLFARELLAGGAAGAIAKTCVAPLERTKILLMTGKAQSDALGTLRALVAAEGLAGLFRGNGASCLRIVPYAAIHFSAYEFYRRQLQEWLLPEAPAQAPPVAAGLATAAGGAQGCSTRGDASATAQGAHTTAQGPTRTLGAAARGSSDGADDGSAASSSGSSNGGGGDDVEQVGSPALTSSIDASTSTHHTGRPPATVPSESAAAAAGARAAPSTASSPAAVAAASTSAAAAAPAAAARAGRLGPGWDLIAGSAAGASAVLLTYPLDIIRTRLAWATEVGAAGSGPAAAGGGAGGKGGGHRILAMMVHTYTHEGVAGLYRGLAPTLYGILPYAGLKFYVYASLKNWYKDTAAVHSSNGISNSRNGSSSSSSGAGAIGSSTSRHGGGASGASERLPIQVMLAFGGVSGLLAQTVTYPLDVVRRRMQVAGLQQQQQPQQVLQPAQSQAAAGMQQGRPGGPMGGRPPPPVAVVVAAPAGASTWGTAAAIARGEGLRGLFRGLSLNYVKVVPSTAIGFAVYDSLKDFLGVKGNL